MVLFVLRNATDGAYHVTVSIQDLSIAPATFRQQFHKRREISGFRSSGPRDFPFTFHALRGSASRTRDDAVPFRRASSTVVNVSPLLHPSMPGCSLPSINISFHLSGSNAS